MVEQCKKGNRTTTTFSSVGWNEIQKDFNKKTGCNYTDMQLKNKFQKLRKVHKELKNACKQMGFSMDPSRKVILAEDDEWEAYLRGHPNAKNLRTIGCPLWDELQIIFGDATSEDKDMSLCPSRDRKDNAKWTRKEERIFVELMVEQCKKGNRTTTAFSSTGWKEIQKDFNKKTGCNYTDMQLKNKFQKLRLLHKEFKNACKETGFSMDPFRKVILADDGDVWEAYVRDHPNAKNLQTTGCQLWDELCIIFGDITTIGEYTKSFRQEDEDTSEDEDTFEAESINSLSDSDEHQTTRHISFGSLDPLLTLDAMDDTSQEKSPISPKRAITLKDRKRKKFNNLKAFSEACMAFTLESMYRINKDRKKRLTSVPLHDPYPLSRCIEVLNNAPCLDAKLYGKAMNLCMHSYWREVICQVPRELISQVIESAKEP
ncbi:PREDICTED: L10-interacting MYB domain-containing protein-like isoform X2 [Nelumbo nucifera]|nr:PREDICTED: L10-interacting MYB domain-containing protein-like isoform X2 [Nelumbo nucifera]